MEFDTEESEEGYSKQRLSLYTENMNILNSITEREIVIQFIHKMDGLIKRKQKILQALDVCHTHYANEMRSSRRSSDTAQWNQHYKWLHANLNRTNLSLECFQVLMQMLYSKVYTGRAATKGMLLDQRLQMKEHEHKSQGLLHSFEGSTINSTWLHTLNKQSLSVSSSISSKLYPMPKTTTEITTKAAKHRKQYMSSRLLSSSSMILSMHYCIQCMFLEKQSKKVTPDFNSIQKVLFEQCKRFEPREILDVNEEEMGERNNAYCALIESVKKLCAELAMLQAT